MCGSPQRIVPHVKTHKSADVLRMQIDAGMTSFKCATLNEAELLARGGAKEIIVAYPLLHPKKLERFMRLIEMYSETDFKVILSTTEHLNALAVSAKKSNKVVGVYVDLDTGMHRTGVQPGEHAATFYTQAASTDGIKVLGIHVFDGHTLYKPDLEERKMLVSKSVKHIHDVWEHAAKQGLEILDNLVGGSWSFHLYPREPKVRVSPGTWIYWDSRNASMPELNFQVAAVVLGQVIDRNLQEGTVTVDIGSKAIAPDQPIPERMKLVGYARAELVSQSEEHGVIKLNGEVLDVGEMVLAKPGHACTTTVKYPFALVVDKEGNVNGRYDHIARDH